MNGTPMIWANLLHLGFNMWEDREVNDTPLLAGRCMKPYLRFDRSLWEDLTGHMVHAGMNLVLIDVAEGLRYDSHPELAVQGSWSPAELRAELTRLRSMGLEPIPKLNFSTSHDTWLGDYGRMVSTPRYYEVVKELIREVSDIFDCPRFFHLGMDEESYEHQKFYEFAVVRQYDLWWRDLYFLVDQVEALGSRAWIWSDYIWNHPEAFVAKMPRSVVQSNWYYGERFGDFPEEDVTSPKYVGGYRLLEEYGYDQIPTGSNWACAENFERTIEFCREVIAPERLLGFMTAPWHPTLESSRKEHFTAVDQVRQAQTLFSNLGPGTGRMLSHMAI